MDIEDLPCEFVCGIEDDDGACEMEVYSMPQEEQVYLVSDSELQALQRCLDETQQLQSCEGVPRFSAANQVLPLLTSVYAERRCDEELGLSAAYCQALRQDGGECRTCQICGENFLSATRLLSHVKQSHGLTNINLQQCFVCRQRYVFPVSLVQHLHQFHALAKPQLTCPVCCTQLSSTAELKAHQRKHARTEACTQCFAHFAAPHQLAEHTDALHGKPFPCSSCRQGFWHGDLLKRHESRHQSMFQSNCICGWQPLGFVDQELALVQHIAICSPQYLQQVLEQARKEDQNEAQLNHLLKQYQLDMSSALDVQSCTKDLIDSVCILSANPTNLNISQELHETEPVVNKYQCQICNPNTEWTVDELLIHVNSVHARSKACALCRKRFSSTHRARAHAKRHMAAREKKLLQEYQCNICDKILPSRSKLNFHLETQHKIHVVDRPHECPYCPRKFVAAANRDKHVAVHKNNSNETEGIVSCQYCEITFIKPKYLKRHEEKYHPKPENPSIKCSSCGEEMESVAKLRRHMVFVHGPAADTHRFQCLHCNVGCRTSSGLKVHLRVHSGERPFSCHICNKGFKRMQALTIHQKSIHNFHQGETDTKMFCCTLCPLKLSSNAAVTKHFLRTHRNLRRFICGLCGERLCQNQQLRQHMETKHETSAPILTSQFRKNVTHIHVFPSIDGLPPTHPHAQLISQLVEKEEKKTQEIPKFPSVLLPIKDTVKPKSNKKTASKEKEDNATTITDSNIEAAGASILNVENLNTVCNDRSYDLTYNIPFQIIDNVPNNTVNFDEFCAVAILSHTVPPEGNLDSELVSDIPSDTYINILKADNSFPNGTSYELVSSFPKSAESLDVLELQPFQVTDQLVSQSDLQQTSVYGEIKQPAPKQENSTKSPQQNLRFACSHPGCSKAFGEKSRLERHKKIHSAVLTHSCTVCSKGFREKHNLTVHMRSHNGDRPYNCGECGTSFRYQQQLLEHQRSHNGDKPFVCTYCPDRSFVRLRDLKRHLATHEPTVRYQCPFCARTLARKDTLTQHLKNVHSSPAAEASPAHECMTCGKFFHSSQQLQQHRILHLGSKDYVCNQCGKGFALKSYLQGHIRTHGKRNKYLQCHLCPRKFASSETLEVHQSTFHVPGRMQHRRQQNEEEEKDVEEHEAVLLHVLADANFDLITG